MGMCKNIIKFGGSDWYAVREFSTICDIDGNRIFLNNFKTVETNLTGAARASLEHTNGYGIYDTGDYVIYHGKRYTINNINWLKIVIENEKTEKAISEL